MYNLFRASFFVLICFFAVGSSAVAQGGYGKVITDENGIISNLNIDDIVYHKDFLYVRGNKWIDSIGLWGLFVAKLDTNGTLIWHNTINDPSIQNNWITDSPSRFEIAQNGDILLSNYFGESSKIGLVVLDSLGQRRFVKLYDYNGVGVHPKYVVQLDSDYYLIGDVQREGGKLDNYILKTDSLGNEIWLKYYGRWGQSEGLGGVEITNEKFISISSYRLSPEFYLSGSTIKGWKSPWIYTIDTSGRITHEWLGERNDTTTLGGGEFCVLPNGDYCIVSRDLKVFPYMISFEVWVSPTVTCLDSNFQMKWKHNLVDFQGFFDALKDIEYDSLRDEIVVSGRKYVHYPLDVVKLEVWVVKLNHDGEILWDITDTVYTDDMAFHEPAGMEISITGSIYVAGSNRHSGNEKGWIIKVGPDGCTDTLCTTTSITEQIRYMNTDVVLYPNPLHDNLHIRIKDLAGVADLQISDLQGRLLQREKVTEGENSIAINLASGMYVCTIVDEGRVVYSGKVVVY